MNTTTTRLSLPDLERYIESIDAGAYAGTRNYIGGSTRLSEYISRGFISLPRVEELLLKNNTRSSAFKLLSELSWREYFHHTWRVRGDEIFEYFRPLKHEPRQGIPTAVLEARTGIDALDRGIRQLYDTGYIDNHMRMWLAGLVSNVAKCDWKVGAAWMHSYLIDGDFASNHLSWQWVAGSYTGSAYVPQQGNIDKYTKSKQSGTYLDRTYAEIAAMDIPEALQPLTVELPLHQASFDKDFMTLDEVLEAQRILLYSPWTLDPTWRTGEAGLRLLVIPLDVFVDGGYSQNVLDSILYFADQISDLHVAYLSDDEIGRLAKSDVVRKEYPGIRRWPGAVDAAELLHPDVPAKFYRSYSAYWKAIKASTNPAPGQMSLLT